jgi:hypothetical protein
LIDEVANHHFASATPQSTKWVLVFLCAMITTLITVTRKRSVVVFVSPHTHPHIVNLIFVFFSPFFIEQQYQPIKTNTIRPELCLQVLLHSSKNNEEKKEMLGKSRRGYISQMCVWFCAVCWIFDIIWEMSKSTYWSLSWLYCCFFSQTVLRYIHNRSIINNLHRSFNM